MNPLQDAGLQIQMIRGVICTCSQAIKMWWMDTVLLSGNSGFISYVYEGNTVKVTDPAGKWKKYTLDALGRLVSAATTGPEWGLCRGYHGFGTGRSRT